MLLSVAAYHTFFGVLLIDSKTTVFTMTSMKELPRQSGADGVIDVTFQDNVAVITMKRGENRFNLDFTQKMHAALDKALSFPNVRALITTGTGRFYSNGADLPWFIGLAETDPELFLEVDKDRFRSLIYRLLDFPLPTIALVNGHAYGAGAIFALAHNHVIMQNTHGFWCIFEVHVNVRLHQSTLEFLKLKLTGGEALHDAVVLGRRFTADEAKSAGIVQESCAPEDMYSRAQTWLNEIVPANSVNNEHLQVMKRDLYDKTYGLQSSQL